MTLFELKAHLADQVGMDTFPVEIEIDLDHLTSTFGILKVEHRNDSPKPSTVLVLSKGVVSRSSLEFEE